MKTSALLLSCLLAVAEAGNIFNCTKPNANFCMGGDIILRCDGNGVGKAGRCSNNLAGYAPIGGPASCYQSSNDAGDAACVKNCVVHASPEYTLPGCIPTYTEAVPTTTLRPHPPHPFQNSTLTTIVTVPTTVPNPGGNPSAPGPNPAAPSSSSSSVVCVGFKCGNGPFYPHTNGTTASLPGTAIGTGTGTPVVPTNHPGNNNNNGGNGNDNGGNGNNNGGNGNNNGSPTFNVPVGPTTTAPSGTIPTSGAMANKAQLMLAAAGLAAAYVL